MAESELLAQYFKWCEERIEEQIALDLRDLRWIGDDYVQFVLWWMGSMDLDEKKSFLLALLARRLQGAYPDYFPEDLSRLAGGVDWERFIAVGREKLLKQHWIAEPRRTLRARARAAKAVAKEILRVERDRGHEVQRQAKGEWFSDSKLEPCGVLRLYLGAGNRGFEYCQNVWVPSRGEPILRESFLSWFGISEDTTISTLDEKQAKDTAEFVIHQAHLFRNFISSELSLVLE